MLSPNCRQLAQRDERWKELVEAGRFDEKKALASLAVTRERIDGLFPATVGEARNCGLPAISTLRLYRGEETMRLLLHYVLTDINTAFGEKKALSPAGIEMVARKAWQRYWHWNLGEIRLAIHKGIDGDYARLGDDDLPDELRRETKAYGSIDVLTVMSWFASYDSLKAQWAAEARESESAKRKANELEFTREGMECMAMILKKFKTVDPLCEEEKKQVQAEAEGRPTHSKTFRYRSIQEYCFDHDVDAVEYMERLEKRWRGAYEAEVKLYGSEVGKDLPYELYRQSRYQQHLVWLNNSRPVDGLELAGPEPEKK